MQSVIKFNFSPSPLLRQHVRSGSPPKGFALSKEPFKGWEGWNQWELPPATTDRQWQYSFMAFQQPAPLGRHDWTVLCQLIQPCRQAGALTTAFTAVQKEGAAGKAPGYKRNQIKGKGKKQGEWFAPFKYRFVS
jgi:hypothetical protein